MTNAKLGKLLIIDDEVELMSALCDALTDRDYETVGVSDPKAGLEALSKQDFDVLLSDLMMPGMDGVEVLRRALEIDPTVIGIIMTGQGTIQSAVEAMKVGAFDYILKPFDMQRLVPILARAMDVSRLRRENVRLRKFVEHITYESARYQIVGATPVMQRVLSLIEKVAPNDATVLIRGASGTGKELVARALHKNSSRRDQPLVTINCAAMQENLLESELFGHEKGAFTGAAQLKRGLIEAAEGGTLFIDEVAEMAPTMQAKLLRVLEDHTFRRVGGTQELRADIRLIAATNKPLEEEQKAGKFREDLYYRLNVVTINLPTLRERRDDIPLLVDHFLKTRQLGKHPWQIDADAMGAIMRYDWPGNVRELANVLERAQILAENNTITIDDLPENMLVLPSVSARPDVGGDDLRDLERRHIKSVLEQTKGNKVHAAKALGVSRRALYRLIEKYKLEECGKAESSAPSSS
jgi:DNA-binding NtrC family response regulator